MGKGIFIHNYNVDSAIDSVTNGILQEYRAKQGRIDPFTFVDLVNENTINLSEYTSSGNSQTLPAGNNISYTSTYNTALIDENNYEIKKVGNILILTSWYGTQEYAEQNNDYGRNYLSSGRYSIMIFKISGTSLTYVTTQNFNVGSNAQIKRKSDTEWYYQTSSNLYKYYVNTSTGVISNYSVSLSSINSYYPQYYDNIIIDGNKVYITGTHSSNYSGYYAIHRYTDTGTSFSDAVLKFSNTSTYAYYNYNDSINGGQTLMLSDSKFIVVTVESDGYTDLRYIDTSKSTSNFQSYIQLFTTYRNSSYIIRRLYKINENSFCCIFSNGTNIVENKYLIVNNSITLLTSATISNTVSPNVKKLSSNLRLFTNFYNNTVQFTMEEKLSNGLFYYSPIVFAETTANLFASLINVIYIDQENILVYGYQSSVQQVRYAILSYTSGGSITVKATGDLSAIISSSPTTSGYVSSFYINNRIVFFGVNGLKINLYSYILANNQLILQQVLTLPTVSQDASRYPWILGCCAFGSNLMLAIRDYHNLSGSYLNIKLIKIAFVGGRFTTINENSRRIFQSAENSSYQGISDLSSGQKFDNILLPFSDTQAIFMCKVSSYVYCSLITLSNDENKVINALESGQVTGIVTKTCTDTTKGEVFLLAL